MLIESQIFLIYIASLLTIAFAVIIYFYVKPQKPKEEKPKETEPNNPPQEKKRLNFKFHARYLPYVFIAPLMLYFFYWAFIHDYVHWGKNIYQIIESQPHNIFYLWVCTFGLLVDCTIALIFFPRTKTVFFPHPKIEVVRTVVEEPEEIEPSEDFGKFATTLPIQEKTK